jgi:hypothetical protein
LDEADDTIPIWREYIKGIADVSSIASQQHSHPKNQSTNINSYYSIANTTKMHFSLVIACAAALVTASPIALPLKSYASHTGIESKTASSQAATANHESIEDQLEALSKLSDKVTSAIYSYRGEDFSSLESLLYEFSSATDELSFTAQDGKSEAKLDEEDSEDVLDALPYTERHFKSLMQALDAKKDEFSLEQLKVVANILYNTKVSIAQLMSGIADITTRSEDITYLTKPYEDDVFDTWRSFEKDANPDWYVSDQDQLDARAAARGPAP